ncbi:PREDICTED: UDP-glycosyltransferase 91A1-like [Ipomoea nil]|uniref:UDP-glycosyltransferase 91A1-like n=1 Tax=Ipomoea nil TaxID=35883 RepID=UPI0009012C17|nr:PREDICTED: UDP-glycosyltransferase 91A1-like [Ipomoea nil]
MADQDCKLHIVMFPWLAFGHMIPFLELTKLIAQKGHKVSFVSTPRNIDRLPKLPPSLASLINFVKLPLPPIPNLPENAEATIDLPYDDVKYLKKAHDGLREAMAKFLEEYRPDWVLFDFDAYWVPEVASEFGVSTAFFSIYIAALLGFIGPGPSDVKYEKRTTAEEFTVRPKWVRFDTPVAYRLHEVLRIFNDSVAGDEDNVSDLFRFQSSAERCDVLAVRSCSEFEPEWLNVLEEIHGKQVFPVGQLPTTGFDGGDDGTNESWNETKRWLDNQARRSVVYVAFGSEVKPSQLELTEIALGLELSGLPFFWVLRTKRGDTDSNSVQLPEGFEERTRNRGVVCTSWAPQLRILSHDSVGGFLTHSGWSSVVEAIQFEKPLVLLTFLSDQGINSRVIEEKKMGYPIPRDPRDGSFTRDSVANSVRLVVAEEDGRIYRDKIKEMKGLFCDKDRQDAYVERLLCHLRSHRNPQNSSLSS